MTTRHCNTLSQLTTLTSLLETDSTLRAPQLTALSPSAIAILLQERIHSKVERNMVTPMAWQGGI